MNPLNMQFFGVALWAWLVIIVSLLFNVFLLIGIKSIKKRAEQLGMPVKGKDKIGVISILWGKNVWMKYTPTIDNNTVEIELDKEKGVKGVWSVEDLYTKPVRGLYGVSAALLTYDVAHAIDPEIDHELSLIENADMSEEAKEELRNKLKRLLTLYREEAYFEAIVKKLEESMSEGTDEYRQALEKLIKIRGEIDQLEKDITLRPLVSRLKKGEAFVFTGEDGTAYIVRQVNIERIKRFAKALSPVSLWASIKAYYETLAGDKTDFYKVVLSIAVLLIVAGIVIAIVLAVRGNGIDVNQLAQALRAANQPAQNVSRVVVG